MRHLALAALSVFMACAANAQSPADPNDSAFPAAAPAKASFEFVRIRSRIQPGDLIGHFKKGMFCGSDGGDPHATAQIEQISTANARNAFKTATHDPGTPVFEREISPFESGESKSADYRIGGVFERVALNTCTDGRARKGSMEIEVKWDVYSTRLQKVVLSKTTVGLFKTDDYAEVSFETLSYANSLRNLMQSDEFKALAARQPPTSAPAPTWQPLHLKAIAAVEGDAQQHAAALAKAVVTIESDLGSGTGFYIADGYLLTDRHVVGSAKYVKVKLSNGKQLVGEVLRQDVARDVALLQTEPSGMPTLHVTLVDPAVGSSMFAIGSPLGDKLAGTFTRGVLSGVRDVSGTRYLQSDVAINRGNSGGPMLDASSRVVGLADLVINQTQGLSFFVPIKDALDRLAVVVDETPTH